MLCEVFAIVARHTAARRQHGRTLTAEETDAQPAPPAVADGPSAWELGSIVFRGIAVGDHPGCLEAASFQSESAATVSSF